MRATRRVERWTMACLGAAALSFGGCSQARPAAPHADASASNWARYVPPPDRFLQSALLRFESPTDLAFVQPLSGKATTYRIATDPLDAANHALELPSGAGGRISISGLVRGRAFPGPWDLIGVRCRLIDEAAPDAPVSGAVKGMADFSLDAMLPTGNTAQSRVVNASDPPAGGWSWLWFNVAGGGRLATSTATSGPASTGAASHFSLSCWTTNASMMIDDIVLAQSWTSASESTVPQTDAHWQVRRNGRWWEFCWNEAVRLRVPAAPFAPGGYAVVEADPTRVLLQSPTLGTLAVNRLGRMIKNGQVTPEAGLLPVAQASGDAPPQVEVIGTTANDDGSRDDATAGRVERTLPGDRNNDGYDETRGCAVVRAQGPRINVRLSARPGAGQSAMHWPVLEVIGLPPGKPSVFVEGQTVPWTTRLGDGRLVVELPVTLADRVDVQVRVR